MVLNKAKDPGEVSKTILLENEKINRTRYLGRADVFYARFDFPSEEAADDAVSRINVLGSNLVGMGAYHDIGNHTIRAVFPKREASSLIPKIVSICLALDGIYLLPAPV